MLQTAVRLHSSLLSTHDVLIVTPFNPNVHHRGLWDRSSLGQFEASSYKAAPKGLPSSSVQHDDLVFVTQSALSRAGCRHADGRPVCPRGVERRQGTAGIGDVTVATDLGVPRSTAECVQYFNAGRPHEGS